jgi:hypothetical protein
LTNFDVEVILSAGKYFHNVLKIYETFISMLFGTRIRRKKSFCVFRYFEHILMSFDFKVILSAGKYFPNVFNIYGMLRSM